MRISRQQKQDIKKLSHKYNLKMVLLFGSQVNGLLHQESDIDIAFLPMDKLTFGQECRLNYQFTEIFHNEKVDTTNLQKAPPLLMKQIIDNCQMLYQKEDDVFDKFEVYALQRYQEAGPLFSLHQESIKNFLYG